MVTGAIIGSAVAGLAGSALSAKSAKKAGKQQAGAAQSQLALQQQIFDTTTENQQPFIDSGQLALEGLLFELGLGDAPTIGGKTKFKVGDQVFDTRGEAESFATAQSRPASFAQPQSFIPVQDGKNRGVRFEPVQQTPATPAVPAPGVSEFESGGRQFGGFQESPGFKFAKQQGISAIDASAAASGGLFSGSTLQALNEFGSGFASLNRGTFLDRLAQVAGAGQGAASALSGAGVAFGQGAGSAIAGIGNAKSAGTIGFGNALQGGLNSLSKSLGAFGNPFGGGGGSNPFGGGTKPTLNF